MLAAGRDATDLCTSLALLALDPEARDLPILVSIPTVAFTELAGEVARLAMFYRLRVRLLASEGVADACDALQAAAGHTDADTLIVVASGVFPVTQGWIGRLERAFRARGGRALISPTVLFEDESVQFAGLVIEDDGRERRVVERNAGFPRANVAGAGGGDVLAGTVACCIVPRRAIVEHGILNRGYLGATHKFRDLCLRLRLAGTPSVWLPGVEMIAADDAGQASALPRPARPPHLRRPLVSRSGQHQCVIHAPGKPPCPARHCASSSSPMPTRPARSAARKSHRTICTRRSMPGTASRPATSPAPGIRQGGTARRR